jgi:hypothetical protein
MHLQPVWTAQLFASTLYHRRNIFGYLKHAFRDSLVDPTLLGFRVAFRTVAWNRLEMV